MKALCTLRAGRGEIFGGRGMRESIGRGKKKKYEFSDLGRELEWLATENLCRLV